MDAAAQGDGPNYDREKEKCKEFLQGYQHMNDEGQDVPKYVDLLQAVADRQQTVVEIALDDILAYQHDEEFVENIVANTNRYTKLFCEAIDEILPAPGANANLVRDVWDVLAEQRRQHRQDAMEQPDADIEGGGVQNMFPPTLMRRYECRLVPPGLQKPEALRNIRAADIGKLVSIRAMVTRVSDVKPLVAVVTYTCDTCGYEVYQEPNSRQFNPLSQCPTQPCTTNQVKGKLYMQTRGSKFIKYQEVRIQELPDQVPIGHIPRSMTIQTHGELTRQCSPGDIVTVAGVFLPVRFTGYRAQRAGLTADVFLEAMSIERHKKGYLEFELSPEMEAEIDKAAEDPDVFSRLARSIAPEIYGHEDVKKALLLQLVGGVSRCLPDGMKIRGDINVCLMGDPGVAKSQLLKYIASVAPRGVYTTGKGSSGVGLTAAISRDNVTGEMALEGGALVLADRGICCIDEFDKMQEADRSAIHEVMEQQTVSIAKAGITTTLNARAAVLAAANPLYGRYNKRKPMSENINLPNSLLSRFDLLFLILDKADMELDMALARHVSFVHQYQRNPDLDFEPVTPTFLKHYIAEARKIDPYIPIELRSYIVEAYVALRQQDADTPSDQTAMTARQLLSMLRLSQALARLKFQDAVTSEEVDEAIRLTHMSKASLIDDDGAGFVTEDATSRIYSVIRDYSVQQASATLNYKTIEAMVVKKGFSLAQLQTCLEDYQLLGVLSINADQTQLTFSDEAE